MSDCKIYPANTVDVTGYSWPTVGENIRNGGFPKEIKSVDIVINNGSVIGAPSFVVADIPNSRIFFQKKTIIFVAFIKTISGDVRYNGHGISTDGYIDIKATGYSGTIRVFYYDN